MKRELGVWKRLSHPNIVPLLGKAYGAKFGSDYPCMISMWMPKGTLAEYIETRPLLSQRIQLVSIRNSGIVISFIIVLQIQGTTAGLEHRTFQ